MVLGNLISNSWHALLIDVWMTMRTLGISVGLPLRIKLFHIYHSVKTHRAMCLCLLWIAVFQAVKLGKHHESESGGDTSEQGEVRTVEPWKLPHQAFLRVQVGALTFISWSCFQLNMKLGRYVVLRKAWDGDLSVSREFPRPPLPRPVPLHGLSPTVFTLDARSFWALEPPACYCPAAFPLSHIADRAVFGINTVGLILASY